ncbi:hypothetical protein NQ315_009979 [Exocentrus adspersus]|uniref:Dimethyladenosine transferase 2, mitochondrial n=1 Tax=Exocentrus adspersus TaxID=1586481 RepID=A0AAV8WIP7_9CUCU|nr:hypothetical protein NQ315_009979 [Exocentrus adspersus]
MGLKKHLLRVLKCGSQRSFCTKQPVRRKRVSHKMAIANFFLENNLSPILQHLPRQYLKVRKAGSPESLYLVCPKTAKTIASYVKAAFEENQDQIIAETNAGLGLIATELLDSGVRPVRLYEPCPDFRLELKDFGKVYTGQVELFTKDIFHLHRYSYMDQRDSLNRVQTLLKNVPKKSWKDDPVMTIVGSMPRLTFLMYLVKCLCLQYDTARYGRFQMFAIIRPRHYAILNATKQDVLTAYQPWTVLYNLLFDYELLEKFPRKVFLPWETALRQTLLTRYPANLEPDKMYLVKINFKKELPLDVEHLLKFFYYVKHFFGRGANRVIPVVEKWIPGSGLNIMLPKLKHDDFFDEVDIFTQFRELTPTQLLAVFKELLNYPSFANSPFTAMIEDDLVKKETMETSLNEATPQGKNMTK